MNKTFIVRPVEPNGRVVLPKHLVRDVLKSTGEERIAVEVFHTDDSIILKRLYPTCAFCENIDDLIKYNERYICPDCLKNVKKL